MSVHELLLIIIHVPLTFRFMSLCICGLVNSCDDQGNTLLHMAVKSGSVRIVEAVLRAKDEQCKNQSLNRKFLMATTRQGCASNDCCRRILV